MRLSARVDYALRAVAELASSAGDGKLVTADRLASAQQIPPKFLESILLQLRRGGVVVAQRGPEGGYRLARPAGEISLAEIIRVIDGPLATVPVQRPEERGYLSTASAVQDVWIALRANDRLILETVTIEDDVTGELRERVRDLVADPRAWV